METSERGVVSGFIASVLLPRPLPGPLDYAFGEGLGVSAGRFVDVPLGSGGCTGVVLSVRSSDGLCSGLKPVERVLTDAPCIGAGGREFLLRSARYVCAPPGRMLAMMMRHHGGIAPLAERTALVRTGMEPGRLTPERRAVLEVLEAHATAGLAGLARAAGVSVSVVSGLLRAGILERRVCSSEGLPVTEYRRQVLTSDQARAVSLLRERVGERVFAPVLLDGVTGSGKTEVYMEAVSDLLLSDPRAQVLILLPEIALTQALMDRISRRFGFEPEQWHSGISPARKRHVWRRAGFGSARMVIGARSALFLPFAHLRLIIVDEEHDTSYKQEEGVSYQARDLAVMRAHSEKAGVVLSSATPSLESLSNVRTGRYVRVGLSARPGLARLPEICVVDGKSQASSGLSPVLVEAMERTLFAGEQVLLFMNRRGYAPLVLCRACGERLRAPDTDNWLCEHRYSGRLVCHLSGFSIPRPKECPYCGAKDSLIGVGQGVERIAEQARDLFPQEQIAVLSSDTVRDADSVRALIERMEAGDIQILVGTQMVAKGHNFPNLTLVGVVDADCGLTGTDFRASERTYQLLLQVAGRAGRADKPGRAILQTHMPENPALQALASGDGERFVELEMQARERAGMPPFRRLGAVIVSAPSSDGVDMVCRLLSEAVPGCTGLDVWGPVSPPVAVLRGRHRRRYLVRAGREVDVSAFLFAWRGRVKIPAWSRVRLDVDPYAFW